VDHDRDGAHDPHSPVCSARAAGGNIVGVGVILTEGHDWKTTLGTDAGLVQGLGHIPQFSFVDGKPVPMPETL